MSNNPRYYTRPTIRKLDILSRNQCAAPDCQRKLIAWDGDTIASKICHIEAASEGGSRYNPLMTNDERRHFDNLILLCDECHGVIDNPINEAKYPKELLVEWKEMHEAIAKMEILNNRPSLLGDAINGIASLDFEELDNIGISEGESFGIDSKISFNQLKKTKPLVEEYAKFYTKINSLYVTLESEGSFKKEKLLRNIRLLYTKIKGRYLNGSEDMSIVFSNADNIFEDIESELLDQVVDLKGLSEDISFAIPIIMVDAFIRCKILEHPSSHDFK